MIGFLSLILSNLIVASVIALIAMGFKSLTRYQSLAHAIFVIALIKLITPSIIPVSVVTLNDQTIVDAEAPLNNESPWYIHHADASYISDVEKPVEVVAKQQEVIPPLANSAKPKAIRKPSPQTKPIQPSSASSTIASLFSSLRLSDYILLCWLLGATAWSWCVFASGRLMKRLIALANTDEERNQSLQSSVDRIADRMRLANRPKLVIVSGCAVPMIWASWKHTTLILPRLLLTNLKQKQIDTLIAHELAHVWCSHHWVRRLEIVVMAIYWWCPLVWLIRKRLHETEEEICDAWVTHILPESSADYANALIDTLNFLNSKSAALPIGASGISQFQFLKRRITMIMKVNHKPGLSIVGWLSIAVILGLGIPFSAQPTYATAANPAGVLQDDDQRREKKVRDSWRDRDDEDSDEASDASDAKSWQDRADADEWTDEQDEEELVEEIVEELTEELAEMDSDIVEEIEDIREDLAEGFSEAPAFVQRALSKVDVNGIVQDSLDGAPKSARMFVREVDPVGLVRDLTENQNWDLDDFDPDEVAEVEAKIRAKLNKGISELVDRVQSQIARTQSEVQREVGSLPASVKKELIKRNIVGVIQDILDDSSPIMQQFVEDADLKSQITKALKDERQYRDRKAKSSDRRVRQRQNQRRDPRNEWRDESVDDRRAKLEQKIDLLAEELDRLRTELRTLNRSKRDSIR